MNDQDIQGDRETTEEEGQLAELRKLALTKTIDSLKKDNIRDAIDSFGLFERLLLVVI